MGLEFVSGIGRGVRLPFAGFVETRDSRRLPRRTSPS